MGAYFSMDLNTMAAMLYGQRAEPWHASADIWGSACGQLLATHGDLGAANAVIQAWPLSVGSASHAAFNGHVVGSLASLAEWSTYTGAMSAALRLGGTAIHAAQAVMPSLQAAYDTALALSSVPLIGPFAAKAAVALQTAGAGMMEAVGAVMQAPTAVPPPQQGWQGAGNGPASVPASPVPAAAVTSVLDAADKLIGLVDKGASLAQTVMSLAQSSALESDLSELEVPSLAGGSSTPGALTLGPAPAGTPPQPGVPPVAVAGAVGAVGAAVLRGGGEQRTAGIPGTRIGASEPGLAGGTAKAATGTARTTPAIAPPISPGVGGTGTTEIRSGDRQGRDARTREHEDHKQHLRRSGVQDDLQGRAAREPVERFGRPPVWPRRFGGDGEAVLDEEMFVPESAADSTLAKRLEESKRLGDKG